MLSSTLAENVDRPVAPDGAVAAARSSLARHAIALLALYGLVSLLFPPTVSLGSDVGGRVSGVALLADTGTVDVGYWAEALDPDGSLHPIYGALPIGDGWVAVTSLPMLVVAAPLYDLGGLRLALLVPMLGGVATALAAAALARRLGDPTGVFAFWVTGVATASAVYSLAFWEHSIGLAAMAWAIVGVVDAVGAPTETRRSAVRIAGLAGAAGIGFGVAATMRQEALVYGFCSGIVLGAGLLFGRRRPVAAMAAGAAMSLGCLAVIAANSALERAVIGSGIRVTRSADVASTAGSTLGERLNDAAITTFLPTGSVEPAGVLLAALALVGLVRATLVARRGGDIRPPLVLAVFVFAMLVVDLAVNGRMFVASVMFTAPLAVVGATSGWFDRRSRPVLAIALLGFPMVWAVQYTGGLAAQWGGRYLLASAWALVVIASAAGTGTMRSLVRSVAVLGAVMTAIGVAWTVERSRSLDAAHAELAALDSVVVFESIVEPREAGMAAVDERWLVAAGPEMRAEAADVVLRSGEDRFVFVQVGLGPADPVAFPGFVAVDQSFVAYVSGFDYRLTTYERT